MQVNLYKFTKRKNDTIRPVTSPTVKTCRLKENTSLINPILLVDGSIANLNIFTYAYIPDFARYYFITDIKTVTAELTEYYLEVDVLATYVAQLATHTGHVVYSSKDFDPNITDNRITISNAKIMETVEEAAVFDENGIYVITTFNGNISTPHLGPCSVYLAGTAGMQDIANLLNDTTAVSNIIQYFNGKISDGITGCFWIPVPNTVNQWAESGSVYTATHFCVGNEAWPLNNSMGVLTKPITYHKDYLIHIHRNQIYGSDFRKIAPFTKANLYLPGIGTVDFDLSTWYNFGAFTVSVDIEILTGNLQYTILRRYIVEGTLHNEVVATYTGNVSALIPLGQTTSNGFAQMISGAGQLIGGGLLTAASGGSFGASIASTELVSKYGLPGGIGLALSGAANIALGSFKTTTSASGTMGGRMCTKWPKIRYSEYITETEDPDDPNYIALHGRPNGKMCLLSTLAGGYVQTDGLSVNCNATDTERSALNALVNSGIYLNLPS